MRMLFLLLAISCTTHFLQAQDVNVLQKQLNQILADFTNDFKNLAKPGNPMRLKFDLEGSSQETMIVSGSENKPYISAIFSLGETKQASKSAFDKWVGIFDKVNFNGAKMVGAPTCSSNCGDFVVYSKLWAFDKNRRDLDQRYFRFKIRLEMLDVEGTHTVGVQIGVVD